MKGQKIESIWSLKELPCKVRLSGRRSTRWSILLANGLNGYLDYEIYHRSANVDRFHNAIEESFLRSEGVDVSKSRAYGLFFTPFFEGYIQVWQSCRAVMHRK
jgi:hypothetical protein